MAQEEVWVDLGAAARFMSAEAAIGWPDQVVGPMGTESTTVTLPGLPSSMIDRSVVANRRAAVRESFDEQLRNASDKLKTAYQVQLRGRARVLAADLRESLRELSSEGSEASISAISSILESSATVRGPIIVRLALLEGWPRDERSNFVRFASRKGPVEEEWDAEIARLNKELDEHDLWVSKRIEALLSQFDQMLANERVSNLQRIKEETARADAEAAELARRGLAQIEQLTLQRLLSEESESITGQGATTVVIPAAPIVSSNIDEPAPLPIPYDVLRSRLELWLRIRGYKLSTGPGRAPDKTGEFIAWTNHP